MHNRSWQLAGGSGPCIEGLSDLADGDYELGATSEETDGNTVHLYLEIPPQVHNPFPQKDPTHSAFSRVQACQQPGDCSRRWT